MTESVIKLDFQSNGKPWQPFKFPDRACCKINFTDNSQNFQLSQQIGVNCKVPSSENRIKLYPYIGQILLCTH